MRRCWRHRSAAAGAGGDSCGRSGSGPCKRGRAARRRLELHREVVNISSINDGTRTATRRLSESAAEWGLEGTTVAIAAGGYYDYCSVNQRCHIQTAEYQSWNTAYKVPGVPLHARTARSAAAAAQRRFGLREGDRRPAGHSGIVAHTYSDGCARAGLADFGDLGLQLERDPLLLQDRQEGLRDLYRIQLCRPA